MPQMSSGRIGCLRGCLLVVGTGVVCLVGALALWVWRESRPYRGSTIRQLTVELQQGDERAREAAIRQLQPIVEHCVRLHYTMNCVTGIVPGKGAADHALPLLAEALVIASEDPNPNVRIAAAQMLAGAAGSPFPLPEQVVPDRSGFFARLAQDEEPAVRLAAVSLWSLNSTDYEATVVHLAQAACDEVPDVRRKAVEGLINQVHWHGVPQGAREVARQAIPGILDRIRDDADGTPWYGEAAACRAVTEIGGREALGSLLSLLNRPAEPWFEFEGLSLWQILGPDVEIDALVGEIEDFERLLSHDDARIRAAALRILALSEPQWREKIDLLEAALDDPHWIVRAQAITGMGSCPGSHEDAMWKIVRFLEDEVPEIRLRCVNALGSMALDSRSRSSIADRLARVAKEDASEQVRARAAETVERLNR